LCGPGQGDGISDIENVSVTVSPPNEAPEMEFPAFTEYGKLIHLGFYVYSCGNPLTVNDLQPTRLPNRPMADNSAQKPSTYCR
jgi:hypothetical protein